MSAAAERRRVAEFFYMGGHYPYVWFSWGLTAAVMAYFLWSPVHRRKRLLRAVVDLARRHGQDG